MTRLRAGTEAGWRTTRMSLPACSSDVAVASSQSIPRVRASPQVGCSSAEALSARAEGWRARLSAAGIEASCRPGQSAVGGGSLPGETLPSTLLALPSAHPDRLAARLRAAATPVVALVEAGAVLLDPRTVLPEQDEALLAALAATAGG